MFMDSCGGHANPYHIHTDPICNYETDSATGHSTLLGVSLDGYGIYGKVRRWEYDNYSHNSSALVSLV